MGIMNSHTLQKATEAPVSFTLIGCYTQCTDPLKASFRDPLGRPGRTDPCIPSKGESPDSGGDSTVA